MTTAVSIEVNVRRVLLRVTNIERATRFCRDVLGLRVVVYGPDLGLQAAFLRGGRRHHFLLTTWDGPQEPQTTQATGRAHVAICYPTDRSFAVAIRLAHRAGCEVAAAWVQDDVQVITLNDPEGNAVRISYRARRRGVFNDHDSQARPNQDRASCAPFEEKYYESDAPDFGTSGIGFAALLLPIAKSR